MLICMDQLSRKHRAAKYFHFTVPSHRYTVGMAHTHAPGNGLKPRVHHLIHIPDRTVRNGSHASKGTVGIAADFSPKGAVSLRLIQVLKHHDLGTRYAGHIFPVFFPCSLILLMVLVGRLKLQSDRISYHRPHIRHEVRHRFFVKMSGNIMVCNLLPSIVDRWRIPSFQL